MCLGGGPGAGDRAGGLSRTPPPGIETPDPQSRGRE